MTLTVRLDSALESALERYCLERGVTKSLVVQECLATYLTSKATEAAKEAPDAALAAPVSAAYRAFAEAGLIGAVELGGRSADKAGVRARMDEHFAGGKLRRGEA
jgi:predicted transcriptional regulator